MHRSSIFRITMDYERSQGSYLFDKRTQTAYLDFFGQYASLPLGYRHPIFATPEFRDEYLRVAHVKTVNCEILSDETSEFLRVFSGHPSMQAFPHVHFSCTGALAVEAAVKTAMDVKGSPHPTVLSLEESFHGIMGYAGSLTDPFVPVAARLAGFPTFGWQKLSSPKMVFAADGSVDVAATHVRLDTFVTQFRAAVQRAGAANVAAFVVEPIQATYGDNYFTPECFAIMRALCDEYGMCLIFDEVQTGFGGTGTMWYFEQTGILPDIVVFGKKAQVSGIMVRDYAAKIFDAPVRLEVTWDGTVADMVRGKYILRAYEQDDILANVRVQGARLVSGLRRFPQLRSVRHAGLLVAFDCATEQERNALFDALVQGQFLCNRTRKQTIRLRPALSVTAAEVDDAIDRIAHAFAACGNSGVRDEHMPERVASLRSVGR